MTDSQVTIVVVPRERFIHARRSLESIYDHTELPFKLIYIDGGSPAGVKSYLEAESRKRGFQIVRTNHYLSPNAARNLGLSQAKSKYVVFIDNDALVTPGWLEKLVRCAEETKAWVVGPLYFIGELEDQVIHMAGGSVEIKEESGKRVLYEKHRFSGKRLGNLPTTLRREACDVVEFHCMLVRTDVFKRIGPFDEGLLNTREHVDFCLAVREAGGSIYIEPDAVVTYVPPPPLAWSDFPYFMLRWSEAWSLASLHHFNEKWDLEIDRRHIVWLRGHRRVFLRPLRTVTGRVFGWRADKVERTFVYPVETALNRFFVRGKKHRRQIADSSA